MQISGASRFPYLLYVLTVSGVAYLLKIRNVSAYTSVSVFPVDELLEVNVRDYIPNHATAITTVMATVGGLVVGTSDGSVFCFQLGVVDPSAPGMAIFCLVTCFVLRWTYLVCILFNCFLHRTIVPLAFILFVDIDMVLLVGMHINKVLYSLSYTCVTAGAAGVLFVGIYLMVRF